MKSVLLSLHSKWIEPIMLGRKVYEVRKRAPLCKPPFTVYIYCTRGGEEKYLPGIVGKRDSYKLNGNVCGEFICTRVIKMHPPYRDKINGTCLTAKDLCQYDGGAECLYFMEIENPIMYDTPKNLHDFGLDRAPMSWMYCEGLNNG